VSILVATGGGFNQGDNGTWLATDASSNTRDESGFVPSAPPGREENGGGPVPGTKVPGYDRRPLRGQKQRRYREWSRT
jgi:hypothetical protein